MTKKAIQKYEVPERPKEALLEKRTAPILKQCHAFTAITSEDHYLAAGALIQRIDEGLLDGEEAIIDYKIGEVYPHHAIQTAGYAAGLPHAKYTTPMARFLKRKRFGVQLRETGVPKIVPFDLRSDYEAFVSALYVTAWKRRNEKFYREMER